MGVVVRLLCRQFNREDLVYIPGLKVAALELGMYLFFFFLPLVGYSDGRCN